MKPPQLGLATLTLLTLGTRSAFATSDFPGAIQSDLGLSYTPPCSYCHTNGITGTGTVQTPFGKTMRGFKLVPGNEASLSAALAQLETSKVDSDGDGISDFDELKEGSDPNQAGGGVVAPLTYGCRVGRAGDTGSAPWWVGAAVGAFLIGLRRRGRSG